MMSKQIEIMPWLHKLTTVGSEIYLVRNTTKYPGSASELELHVTVKMFQRVRGN